MRNTYARCAAQRWRRRGFAVTAERGSAGDDEVDRLRPLALLVGLDVEGDALPLGQRFEAGALDRGDVNEHVAPAVIGLDEAVAALGVEELDGTCHRHREAPSPWLLRRRPPRHDGWAGHSQSGKERRPPKASVTPPAPTGGGTSKPAGNKIG